MFAVNRVDFRDKHFGNTKMLPPAEWIPALIELMKGYRKQGAIRSLDALLMKLVDGDAAAALMLKHIMEWQPYGIRDDGAIWRSADEWTQYTGLTRSMVYNETRRDRLKKAGLKVWVERAMGENTMHFLIDAAKLTANISAALGLNYNIALIKLWELVPIEVPIAKDPIPFPQAGIPNAVPRVSNGEIPLTESTTELSTETTTSVLLNSENFSVAEKAKYGVLPVEVVQKIFDGAREKKKAGTLKKPMMAYLRGCLNIALKETASPSAESLTPPPTPYPTALAGSLVERGNLEADAPLLVPTVAIGGTVPSWMRDAVVDVPVWWSVARNQLELQMGRDVWAYLKFLDLGECVGDTVSVIVPQSVPMMMVQRYTRNIERALSDCRCVKTVVVLEQKVG